MNCEWKAWLCRRGTARSRWAWAVATSVDTEHACFEFADKLADRREHRRMRDPRHWVDRASNQPRLPSALWQYQWARGASSALQSSALRLVRRFVQGRFPPFAEPRHGRGMAARTTGVNAATLITRTHQPPSASAYNCSRFTSRRKIPAHQFSQHFFSPRHHACFMITWGSSFCLFSKAETGAVKSHLKHASFCFIPI